MVGDTSKVLKKCAGVSKFIEHNKKVFLKEKRVEQREPLVLCELNSMNSTHIAYSYLLNVLAADNQAKIIAYVPKQIRGLRQKFLFKLKGVIGSGEFGIYKSFGATNFFGISVTGAQRARAKRIFSEVFPRLNTKHDIEALTINGVWVGNLFYDSFLMSYKKATIDKDLPIFKNFLLESIEQLVFWEDFFNNNDVRAINVSHCVYNMAIPLRVAVHRDIAVFQSNITHIYRLSKNNLYAYNDFFYFRERFASLPTEVQRAGVSESKKRINRRFQGEVGVDMAYSTKSAYCPAHHARLLKDSPRKKILIATHCFFDSPHAYGNNIFPDFHEWLDFLGKLSETTDYDWYIKTHPDYLPGTMEIIDSFVAKYSKFTLLPADASHHQIISEGINVALTAYGTIAFEYAALGIPVINASQNNPHIAYDFNLHAKDVDDYRRLLQGLDLLNFPIDKQQVYEYYFMKYIYNTENLFFKNHDKSVNELGGYFKQFTPVVYEKWLDEWEPQKHSSIISAVRAFIDSGDFRMDYRHYGREFTVDFLGT